MGALALFRLPAKSNVEKAIQALRDLAPGAVAELEAEQLADAQAALLFAYWAKLLHHDQALFDDKRKKRLLARLRENNGNVSELLYVLDGAKRDAWIMGQRVDSERRYDGIQTVFRDREQVERLAELCAEYRAGKVHPMAVKYGLT